MLVNVANKYIFSSFVTAKDAFIQLSNNSLTDFVIFNVVKDRLSKAAFDKEVVAYFE